jgi:hypothetical protein
MIIQDFQPISTVEDVGFKDLLAYAFSSYKISCRQTITKRVEEKYEMKKVRSNY